MDSAIVRLAANLEKAVDHLRRRTDEIARFANDFEDFMQAYAERKEQEAPRPAEGERVRGCRSQEGKTAKANPPKKADRAAGEALARASVERLQKTALGSAAHRAVFPTAAVSFKHPQAAHALYKPLRPLRTRHGKRRGLPRGDKRG